MAETTEKGHLDREKLQRLPSWAKKLLVIAGIVGPICGAITTVTVTILDIRSKARAADRKTEAGYETLSPAVNELKEIQDKGVAWANEAAEDIKKLKAVVIEQEKRIIRLETYIEVLSQQRRLPRPPPKPRPTVMAAGIKKPTALKDFDEDGVDDSDEPENDYLEQKSKRVVPRGIDDAQRFQKIRNKERCDPGDPLCGSATITE